MNEWTDYSEENGMSNPYEKCALCGEIKGMHIGLDFVCPTPNWNRKVFTAKKEPKTINDSDCAREKCAACGETRFAHKGEFLLCPSNTPRWVATYFTPIQKESKNEQSDYIKAEIKNEDESTQEGVYYQFYFLNASQKEPKMIDWTKPIEVSNGWIAEYIGDNFDCFKEFDRAVAIKTHSDSAKIIVYCNDEGKIKDRKFIIRNKVEEQIRYTIFDQTMGFVDKSHALNALSRNDDGAQLIKITFRDNKIHSMEVEKE